MAHRTGITSAPGRLLLTLIFGVTLASAANAQRFQAGVDFTAVLPRDDFKQNVNNNGFGVSGNFLVGIGRSPISAGVDAGFAVYGSEKRRVPLSSSIPDITVNVETNNNIVLTHFLVRAEPRRGAVRPYLDGLVGFKYLFTDTNVRSDSSSDPIASTTNLSDFALSYGVGGGLHTRLARLGRGRELMLNTGVRYLWGSNANYLRKGSIRRNDGSVSFDVLSSRTDALTLQAGVAFRF